MVHVWGSIAPRRATPIVPLTGIMISTKCILEAGLLLFIKEPFPDSHSIAAD